MADTTSEADWTFIENLFPEGWRELASEMGLVRKLEPHIGQKVHDIGTALRLVLHYVAQRGSMRTTTAVAAVAGIVSISQPALFKWMLKIGAYLEALVARMVEPGQFAASQWPSPKPSPEALSRSPLPKPSPKPSPRTPLVHTLDYMGRARS